MRFRGNCANVAYLQLEAKIWSNVYICHDYHHSDEPEQPKSWNACKIVKPHNRTSVVLEFCRGLYEGAAPHSL
jgi:hypothetical protein